jgi:hypothetical protein
MYITFTISHVCIICGEENTKLDHREIGRGSIDGIVLA